MEYAGDCVRLTSDDIFFSKRVFALFFGVLLACGRKAPETPPREELTLAWSGCSAVARSRDAGSAPICEVAPSTKVHLVIPANAIATGVRADRSTIQWSGTSRDIEVEVAPALDRIEIDARVGDKLALGVLRLAPARTAPWLDEAKRLRGKGELDKAAEIASAHVNDRDPIDRGLAKGLLARITLARGRADEAFPLFREAIAIHREHGRISDAVDDSFALAFALHQRSQRYGEARAALDAIRDLLPSYPEGNAREPYYRGIVAAETGDRRNALALLREAERRARELRMTRLERNARSVLALEMQELGRARASLVILRALEKEADNTTTPCERVETANNIGWGALLANEAAGAQVEDAREPLLRAIAVEGCSDAYVRSSALSNLARLAVDERDLDTAQKRLAEAKAGVKEPRGIERIGWIDLEARMLLLRGKANEALKRFDDARALARAAVLALPEWSALVGRADALVALGRDADAIAALRDAEDVLDAAALLVPLGEGRAAFVADRSRSAIALVDLLTKKKLLPEAIAAARRSRTRVLAGASRALRIERLGAEDRARWDEAVRAYRTARAALDAEAANDWSLPADQLAKVTAARKERERSIRTALESAIALVRAPSVADETKPPSGVVDIDVHPTKSGPTAFVSDHEGTITFALPPADAAAATIASALFGRARSKLASAKLVRVRAYGAWRGVDVHALHFDDAPLLTKVRVEYPLGLGAPKPAPERTSALVVGDPTGDLPGALAEANSVSEKLGARALSRDAATSKAVTEALVKVDHFHYAGHGVFGGAEGWESALPLASGGRLGVGDVIALAPAPRTVVLAGCEAARSDGDAEGLGLAQAFVIAGAAKVLAPVRPVPDGLSTKLATHLYATPGDFGDAAHRAIVALAEEDKAADWPAFRVLTP